MQFRVFDLETENHEHLKRVASQFCDKNWPVAYGWQDNNGQPTGLYYPEYTRPAESDWYIPDHIDMLVGFNIKYDMLWIWNHPSTIKFLKRGGKIWCCQYAEYLLEGQQQHAQMASLDEVCPKYGGNLKMDVIKEMWNNGVLTSEIDEDLLMQYLLGHADGSHGDIGNTYVTFLGQLARADASGQLKMIATRMDGLLASIEMEYNGLYIDYEAAIAEGKQLQALLDAKRAELDASLPELPEGCTFSWTSRHNLSALLFGGGIKYQKWVQHRDENGELLYCIAEREEPYLDENGEPVRYKSGARAGEIKTRKVKYPDLDRPKGAKQDFVHVLPQQVVPLPEWKGKEVLADGSPVYKTGADVIENIGSRAGLGGIAKLIAECTRLDKDVGTYYISSDGTKGMLTLVGADNIVHHTLNHVTTKTTRMSGSDPNMQNLPRKDKSTVKRNFRSRHGPDGRMIEIDYSQLEVVIQAWYTGDIQMIQDVNDGVDFHCKRLSAKLGEAYEHVLHMCKVMEDDWYSEQRTNAKGFTFQRAYGAAAASIALSLGVPVEEIEALIEAEAKLYPGINEFDELLKAAIDKSAAEAKNFKREAHPYIPNRFRTYRLGEWFSPTGTRFVWRQWEAPAYLQRRGIEMTFSPTERKNWPIQGGGGEVMQMALGLIFRYFVERGWWSGEAHNQVLLVNTVHDCAWADTTEEKYPEVSQCMHDIMCGIPLFMKHRYGVDVPVRFRAEAEVGENMYAMHVYHCDSPIVDIQKLAERYL